MFKVCWLGTASMKSNETIRFESVAMDSDRKPCTGMCSIGIVSNDLTQIRSFSGPKVLALISIKIPPSTWSFRGQLLWSEMVKEFAFRTKDSVRNTMSCSIRLMEELACSRYQWLQSAGQHQAWCFKLKLSTQKFKSSKVKKLCKKRRAFSVRERKSRRTRKCSVSELRLDFR